MLSLRSTPLLRPAVALLVLGFLSYGLLYYAYKYYVPVFGGDDFFEYAKMIASPLEHDAQAPFAYRVLSTGLAHVVYKLGVFYPNEIAFSSPEVNQRVFFAALVANYLCLLAAGFVVMRLVRVYLGVRSFAVQLAAALALFLSFTTFQYVVTGLTEGLSWLLVAVGFLCVLRGWRFGIVAVLVLSIFQREAIAVLFGVFAAVDLVLARRPRRFNVLVLGTSLACFLAYFLMRKVLLPVPGYENQIEAAGLWAGFADFAALGFLDPDFFMMGVLSQNLAGLTVLLAIGLWRWTPISARSPYLPHAVFAALALFLVGYVAGIGSNVGRVLALLNPVWAVLLVEHLGRLDLGEPVAPQTVQPPKLLSPPPPLMPRYTKGDTVTWKWGGGTATGTVQESFTERVTRTIKGTEVIRDADADNPAYLIEQDDGDRVLKSESELSKA